MVMRFITKVIENKVMLITYSDSLGKNLKEILDTYYSKAVGGIHILSFFSYLGDMGFALIGYDVVDKEFGDMEDVKLISHYKYLMYDFMVNHISRQSDILKIL